MKIVEFEGITYKISVRNYGYNDQLIMVNRTDTGIIIGNQGLTNIATFKDRAKEAIKTYIDKKNAEKAFKKWDGKL